jgi:hypothetical protein
MGVSTHPFDSTIVISFWQGDACTGTFRLPVADAAPLIATLAHGMAESIPPGQSGPRQAANMRSGWWPPQMKALLAKVRRPSAGTLRLLK